MRLTVPLFTPAATASLEEKKGHLPRIKKLNLRNSFAPGHWGVFRYLTREPRQLSRTKRNNYVSLKSRCPMSRCEESLDSEGI